MSPHEIHTLDVPDAPILHAYVCCQCPKVVWPDLVDVRLAAYEGVGSFLRYK